MNVVLNNFYNHFIYGLSSLKNLIIEKIKSIACYFFKSKSVNPVNIPNNINSKIVKKMDTPNNINSINMKKNNKVKFYNNDKLVLRLINHNKKNKKIRKEIKEADKKLLHLLMPPIEEEKVVALPKLDRKKIRSIKKMRIELKIKKRAMRW